MQEKGRLRYRCKACSRHFSLLTGTALENTRLPLSKWVLAVALLELGVSAKSLSRSLAVSYRIAWKLLHQIRKALQNDALVKKLKGQVEVDETYVGGRQKGKRGRGAANKTAVIGLKVRKGPVRSLVIPSVATQTIHNVLKTHVARGSRLFTDKFRSYNRVRRLDFFHRRIPHGKMFVRGKTHTQSIEGYWGHLKPTLVARHRSVSPKYLPEYLFEFDFKHRWPESLDFVEVVLKKLMGQRVLLPIK
jgi:transposase-like protein